MRSEYRVWVDRGYADGNEWSLHFHCGRDCAQCTEIYRLGLPQERFVVSEDHTAIEGGSSAPPQIRVYIMYISTHILDLASLLVALGEKAVNTFSRACLRGVS